MINRITRWLLFLTGITLPITEIRFFTLGPLVFSMNKVLTAVLLGWAVIYWLSTRQRFPQDRKAAWVGVFAVAIAISLLVAFFSGASLSVIAVAVMAMSAILLFYFLLVYVTVDFRSLDSLLVGYLVGVSLTSISVLMGYGLEMDEGAPGFARTGGLGGDPNHYSYDAAVSIPIALMYFSMVRSGFARILLIGFGALVVIGIMTTLSRSGVVAAGAALAFWMLRFRRFDVLRVAIPLVAGSVVIMFLTSPKWVERMLSIGAVVSEDEEADSSVRSRLVVGEYAIWALVENPLFGVGYRNFGPWGVEKVREYRQSGRGDVLSKTETGLVKSGGAIHNSYLHVAAEMGLVGLISYLTFLALGWADFSRGFRTAKKFPDDPVLSRAYYYAAFLQISYFATLIDNMFLSSVRFKSAWMLIAVSTVILRVIRSRMAEIAATPSSLPEVPPIPGVDGSGGSVPPPALSPGLSDGVRGRRV